MIFPRVMSVMDSIMPNFRRRNEVILLALASLAGTLGFALFWLTTVWKINMPWNQGLEMRGPFGLACLYLENVRSTYVVAEFFDVFLYSIVPTIQVRLANEG